MAHLALFMSWEPDFVLQCRSPADTWACQITNQSQQSIVTFYPILMEQTFIHRVLPTANMEEMGVHDLYCRQPPGGWSKRFGFTFGQWSENSSLSLHWFGCKHHIFVRSLIMMVSGSASLSGRDTSCHRFHLNNSTITQWFESLVPKNLSFLIPVGTVWRTLCVKHGTWRHMALL